MRRFAAFPRPIGLSGCSNAGDRTGHAQVPARLQPCYGCPQHLLLRRRVLGDKNAYCNDRFRLCGSCVGSVSRGFWAHCHLYRRGCPENRGLEGREDADLRAWPARSRRQQRAAPQTFLFDRSCRRGRWCRSGLYRGRHPVAARRRSCGSFICLPGGPRDRRWP